METSTEEGMGGMKATEGSALSSGVKPEVA